MNHPITHAPSTSEGSAQRAPLTGVHSEVGRLRRVLLHRPGLELKRLTPTNKDELLFDDVLWVKRARQEHDVFADTLADRGVEVLYLQELLSETLEQEPPDAALIARTLATSPLGPRLTGEVEAWLASMSPGDAGRGGHRRHRVRRAAVPRQVAGPRGRPGRAISCSRRCPTTCSPATRRRGSTTG